MAKAPNSKKVANGLVAVGAAAVMAVYAAGYSKTRSAADRFDAQSAGRRPAAPDATPAPAAPAAAAAAIPDAPPPQTATISKPARSPVVSAAPVAKEAAVATAVTPSDLLPRSPRPRRRLWSHRLFRPPQQSPRLRRSPYLHQHPLRQPSPPQNGKMAPTPAGAPAGMATSRRRL